MPFYRAVRGEVFKENGKIVAKDTKVVWEGTDIKELAKKFPRRYFTNGNTLDELRIINTGKSRIITIYLTRENETDLWKIMDDDPRQVILTHPHEELSWRDPTRRKSVRK